jgi:hypothetical protein
LRVENEIVKQFNVWQGAENLGTGRRPTTMTTHEESQPQPSAGRQIAEAIRTLILGGKLVVDERLPGEQELAARFGVSRPTVRDADGVIGELRELSDYTARLVREAQEIRVAGRRRP